ncbi:hypothetical protein RhiirA5_380064 [Rhizophagus irregularis]|uniref:Crinkler family protein n=1 Tax=Rhizophagus irregularis TaxID=588596 RepID=A0A2N0P9R0_9GLOM|nr:hypothetical protein RhiirA5_380064 [Rhizophagus irregularis]
MKGEFDVVVSPKRKSNKWTANIEHATLEGLKDYIRELYKPPALENDGAVLNFMCDGDRYLPRNDVTFQEMLQSLVSKTNLKFTVFNETPSKPFSDWSFPKVCELYGLSDDPNPSIDVYPIFSCGHRADLTCRKRKVDEIEDSYGLEKVWGIVTDAEKWYFMECKLDNEGKPSFKLSEPVIVVYKDENLQDKVEKVLGHIVWLLEEAQKPEYDSQSEGKKFGRPEVAEIT